MLVLVKPNLCSWTAKNFYISWKIKLDLRKQSSSSQGCTISSICCGAPQHKKIIQKERKDKEASLLGDAVMLND
jgi:hypothetical protein